MITRPSKPMVEPTLIGALPQKPINYLTGRRTEIARPEDAVLKEILDVKLSNGRVDHIDQPPSDLKRWTCLDMAQERLWVPTDPRVALSDLHYRAAQSADADNGMEWRCPIPDKKHHCPPGHTGILIRPRVTEVAPNVHKAQPCQ
jgi:hypothetical protein